MPANMQPKNDFSRRKPVLDLRSVEPAAPPRMRPPIQQPRKLPAVRPELPQPAAMTRVQPAARSKVRRPGRLKSVVLNFAFVVVGLGAAYLSTAGQILILIYGIWVLIWKVDSRKPFAAALFFLILIPVFQILKLSLFSSNAAIYAYELLVVGVIAAASEMWRDESVKKRVAHQKHE